MKRFRKRCLTVCVYLRFDFGGMEQAPVGWHFMQSGSCHESISANINHQTKLLKFPKRIDFVMKLQAPRMNQG